MVQLNFRKGLFQHKWLLGILLICSVAYGAKHFQDVVLEGLTVNDLTADTVPYADSSKVLTSSAVTPTELAHLVGQDQGVGTGDSPTFVDLTLSGLTADTVPYADGSKQLASSAVNSTELGQLATIDSSTISSTQWGYVGGADQAVKTTDTPSFTGLTSTGAVGADFNPGSDIDTDILSLGVTGSPIFSWDESEDAFNSTHGISSSGILKGTGLTTTDPVIFSHETTPANPSSGNIKLYPKSDNVLYILDSSGTETAVGTGSGSGGINYALNPDFEASVDDMDEYDDGAVATPVDGTGGTASNLAITQTTTSSEVIRGEASLKLAKSAADAQGEGMSTDFTIDNADKGETIEITFDKTTTANYESGFIKMFVYDVTNTTMHDVQNIDDGSVSPTSSLFRGSFISASDSTSYRLIWHVVGTEATAWDLFVDNLRVGPLVTAPGVYASEWKEYTPTFTGFGTPTGVDVNWRRVGDSIEIQGTFVSDTTTAVTAKISLPNNYEIEFNKLSTARNSMVGGATRDALSTSNDYRTIVANGDDNMQFSYTSNATAGNEPLTPRLATNLFAGSDVVVLYGIKIPIVGWDVGAQLSPSEVELVSVRAEGNDGTGITANVTDINFTEVSDNFNAWDGDSFTAPRDGNYTVVGNVFLTAVSAGRLVLYVDTVATKVISTDNSTTVKNFSGDIYLNKGEVLTLRSNIGATHNNNTTFHHIQITEQPNFKMFGIIPRTPTIQTFTSGSGTYTRPDGVRYIKVRMVGGGGGGSASNSGSPTNGGTGGNTTFGTSLLTANGGVGGVVNGVGGSGGAATVSSPAIGNGLNGGAGGGSTQVAQNSGGAGGSSAFGGGGKSGAGGATVGVAGSTNTGGGGGGGGSVAYASGAGGGSGGYVDAIITNPSSTYAYAVGAAGTAGTGTFGGGAGGSGIIIVEEY